MARGKFITESTRDKAMELIVRGKTREEVCEKLGFSSSTFAQIVYGAYGRHYGPLGRVKELEIPEVQQQAAQPRLEYPEQLGFVIPDPNVDNKISRLEDRVANIERILKGVQTWR